GGVSADRPGPRGHALAELHAGVEGHRPVLGRRGKSQRDGRQSHRPARLQLPTRPRRPELRHPDRERPRPLREDARPDAGLPQGPDTRPDGKPDAQRVKAFSDANPETLNQAHFIAARPVPASYAGTVYWGVHAFPATNADGHARYIKFKVVPAGGEL